MPQVESFIPLFGRDFLASTMGWTATERGHYITLLITQWEQGGIPEPLDRIGLISHGVDDCWATLEPKFPVWDDGVRRNHRMEEHRQKAQSLAESRSAKARRAASARWNAPSNAPSNASASSGHDAPSMREHFGIDGEPTTQIDKRQETRAKAVSGDAPSMRQAMPQICPPSPSPSPIDKEEPNGSSSVGETGGGIRLPVDGGGDWIATGDMVREWRETYPTLDIQAQMRRARQWLLDNPSRQKTKRGMRRFMGSWLATAANNASTQTTKKTTSKTLAAL